MRNYETRSESGNIIARTIVGNVLDAVQTNQTVIRNDKGALHKPLPNDRKRSIIKRKRPIGPVSS